MFGTRGRPAFNIKLDDPTETLIAGFAEYGLAGLTAADYLRKQLDLEQVGHIAVDQLPAVTPFEDGTPRHHTRLFSKSDLDITIAVGELFVPTYAAEPFGNAVLEYTDSHDVEEVVVLSGVPTAHGPDDHRPFYVASEDYQEAHLEGDDVVPMPGGFLDGLNGALMERAIDGPLKGCVFTTPVHEQVPDVDAALRLLEAVEAAYGLGVDTAPLEEFAAAVSEQYAELAARLEAQQDEHMPEDRMYM
jgi:uncharacterized protein